MEEQKNIPELRFPGFDGEWELRVLKDYFKERSETSENDLPLYSLTIENGITPKSKRYERSFLVNDESDAYKTMHNDDFAFNPMNLRFGALARHKGNQNVAVSKYYNIFYCREKDSSAFFEYYLTNDKMIAYYNKMATGSLIEKRRVHYLDFIKFNRHLPSFPEQQKIASFFTAIDKKISQLKQKKTLLEQYKKGVMQKIFSQEPDEGGSRTPIKNKQPREQIRFRDENGQEFPKWEKKKFNEVYSFKTTNSFSRDNLNYESGKVRNIHYGDIHTKYPILLDITKHELPYINSDISITKIKEDSYCINNDLVFADASEDVPDVGKCIELVNLNGEKVLAGLHTILARPVELQISNGFGGYLMASIGIRKQIMKISQGSKVTSISSSRLGEIEIDLPCPAEQSNIANFLSAIDAKINHTQTQIENAERWKKGLLQKMFC